MYKWPNKNHSKRSRCGSASYRFRFGSAQIRQKYLDRSLSSLTALVTTVAPLLTPTNKYGRLLCNFLDLEKLQIGCCFHFSGTGNNLLSNQVVFVICARTLFPQETSTTVHQTFTASLERTLIDSDH